MAEVMAWPLNLAEYAYNAEDVQRWMAGKTSGVYGAEGNWQVVAAGGMKLTVKATDQPGGWLSNLGRYGVVFWNSTDISLTVPTADGTLPRVDRVVVSWHIPQQSSVPTVEVRKGVAASNPIGPALVNDGEYAEICLAEIRLTAGQTEITAEGIIDTRLNEDLCGLVSAGMEKYPTDGLEAEFRAWLDDLKTQLEGDVAANLQNQITTHVMDTSVHLRQLEYAKSGTVHQLTGLTGVSGIVSCVFTATDGYVKGDTVTVDDEEYAVQLSSGETASDKLFVSGATVSVVVDKENKRVNFKAGGGYVKGDVIAAENIECIYSQEPTNQFVIGPLMTNYNSTVTTSSVFGSSSTINPVYKIPGPDCTSTQPVMIRSAAFSNMEVLPDYSNFTIVRTDYDVALMVSSHEHNRGKKIFLCTGDHKTGSIISRAEIDFGEVSLYTPSFYSNADQSEYIMCVTYENDGDTSKSRDVVIIRFNNNLQELSRVKALTSGSIISFSYKNGFFYGLLDYEEGNTSSHLVKINEKNGEISDLLNIGDSITVTKDVWFFGDFFYVGDSDYIRAYRLEEPVTQIMEERISATYANPTNIYACYYLWGEYLVTVAYDNGYVVKIIDRSNAVLVKTRVNVKSRPVLQRGRHSTTVGSIELNGSGLWLPLVESYKILEVSK